jgi:hypothetical protein
MLSIFPADKRRGILNQLPAEIRKLRFGQPRQKALVYVELKQLLGVATLGSREVLQIQVGLLWRALAHANMGSISSAITVPTRS